MSKYFNTKPMGYRKRQQVANRRDADRLIESSHPVYAYYHGQKRAYEYVVEDIKNILLGLECLKTEVEMLGAENGTKNADIETKDAERGTANAN